MTQRAKNLAAIILLATLPAFAASKPPKPVAYSQPRLCSPGGLPVMVPCPRVKGAM